MALSKAFVREVFSGAGADPTKIPEAVDKIVDGNVASIDALREEINDLKSKLKNAEGDSSKLKTVQKELDGLKEQIKGKDYDALKKEYDDYKAEQTAKETRRTKETALRGLLKDLNMSEKGTALAVKYTNFDTVEVDENGALKDAAGLKKTISEDWGDYVLKEKVEGASTQNPPENNKGGGMTKEQIMEIKDSTERQKAIAENPELFGLE